MVILPAGEEWGEEKPGRGGDFVSEPANIISSWSTTVTLNDFIWYGTVKYYRKKNIKIMFLNWNLENSINTRILRLECSVPGIYSKKTLKLNDDKERRSLKKTTMVFQFLTRSDILRF